MIYQDSRTDFKVLRDGNPFLRSFKEIQDDVDLVVSPCSRRRPQLVSSGNHHPFQLLSIRWRQPVLQDRRGRFGRCEELQQRKRRVRLLG